jgi:hypothetical protein
VVSGDQYPVKSGMNIPGSVLPADGGMCFRILLFILKLYFNFTGHQPIISNAEHLLELKP